MTQKELLYIEDAIGHEQNIISIIYETINMISDEKLISFLEKEEEKHTTMKDKLINCLKENCDER